MPTDVEDVRVLDGLDDGLEELRLRDRHLHLSTNSSNSEKSTQMYT